MIRLSHVAINRWSKVLVDLMMDENKIGQSEMINRFEYDMASWLGVKHCIAVSSGTMADTIALAVLKHFNPGKDEVLVPALTFIAQVNAIYYNQLKPVFFDINPDLSMYLPVDKITKKTLCIFPTHLLGKPVSATDIKQAGTFYKVPVIEDACEALGSESLLEGVGFRKCGTIGGMGTFSFFPSHTISTGEGGMIATNDDDYAAIARRLRNHGKTNTQDFHFDLIGFNGKMSSLEAAIGVGFVPHLSGAVEKRREVFFALGGKENPRIEKICPHAFPVIAESRFERDRLLDKLRANGIECRNLFSSIPTQEQAYAFLGHKLGDFPIAEMIGDRGLYVPSHGGLSQADVFKIQEVLRAEGPA